MAFALAAFIAGIGGALTGYQQGELTPEASPRSPRSGCSPSCSSPASGRISGAVVAGIMFSAAGLFVTFLDIHLSVGKYQALVAGVALVLTAVQNPDGITSTATGKGPAVALARLRDRFGLGDCVAEVPGPRAVGTFPRGDRHPPASCLSWYGLATAVSSAVSSASRSSPRRAPRRAARDRRDRPAAVVVAARRRRAQLAYRIRTDNGWDTGGSRATQSVLVAYGGPPLRSGAARQLAGEGVDRPGRERVVGAARVRDRPARAGGLVGALDRARSSPSRVRRGSGRRAAARRVHVARPVVAPGCTPPRTGSTRRSSTASGSATPS